MNLFNREIEGKLIEITNKFHLLFPCLFIYSFTLRQDDPRLTLAVEWKRKDLEFLALVLLTLGITIRQALPRGLQASRQVFSQ